MPPNLSLASLTRRVLRKHPILVPDKVPNREEASADKLTNIRRDAYLLQTSDDQVIYPEVHDSNNNVPPGATPIIHSFTTMLFKNPVVFKNIVNRQANQVSGLLSNE